VDILSAGKTLERTLCRAFSPEIELSWLPHRTIWVGSIMLPCWSVLLLLWLSLLWMTLLAFIRLFRFLIFALISFNVRLSLKAISLSCTGRGNRIGGNGWGLLSLLLVGDEVAYLTLFSLLMRAGAGEDKEWDGNFLRMDAVLRLLLLTVLVDVVYCSVNCLISNFSSWSISTSCSCSCHDINDFDGDDGGGFNGYSSSSSPICCSFCSLSSDLLAMPSLLPAAVYCIIVVFVF